METVSNSIVNESGVYIILNLVDCKAYVGKAKKLNSRNHLPDLIKRIDNNKILIEDFQSGKEFVYFVLLNSGPSGGYSAESLNFFEQMYMTLVESGASGAESRFILYNDPNKPARKNRTKEELQKKYKCISTELGYSFSDLWDMADEQLNKEFAWRFGKNLKDLAASSETDRRNALEYYVHGRRLNKKLMAAKRSEEEKKRPTEDEDVFMDGDVLYLNKERIKSLLEPEKAVKFCDLIPELSECFFSKAGSYIGDGLEQILAYEQLSIEDYGYCLWTFGGNQLHMETVTRRCRELARGGKPIYVVFRFTPSSVYASGQKFWHRLVDKRSMKLINSMPAGDNRFLQDIKNSTKIPSGIECTTTSQSPALAFVVRRLFPIDDNIQEYPFLKAYEIVNKPDHPRNEPRYTDPTKRSYQRNTFFICQKEGTEVELIPEASGRVIYFAAELAAPYVVRLE